ncbi:hypothetical protein GP486_005529 [Trichoglossum hirsutum]|uniref:Uncharacterized protein n=1 Tax=Trichoglossum hirsutum TaxID=265104 RepID=A0A9P8L8Z8_9PEZI|nr:hypothetical protein GP486_005529 [Trichoglossum hirsutum]
MSSDEAYAAFLDKANETPLAGGNSSIQSVETKAIDTSVPASLQSIDKYYVSEADEPFTPVGLKWNGKGFPSKDEFRDLIKHKAEVSIMNTDEWDPRGDYAYIVGAVQEAAGTREVKVYRVRHGHTRAEYYIVSLDPEGSRIVGLKAKAVES